MSLAVSLPPGPGATKRQLRSWAREARPALRAALGNSVDTAVCAALRGSEAYQAAGTVGIYLALPDEVNVLGLTADAKRFVAPRMHEAPEPHLTFHEVHPDELETHAWGVRQPSAAAAQVALEDIDLLLVPGLLFDVTGVRVGFGKGYYDRLLAPTAEGGTRWPLTVGVAYEALVLTRLPAAVHDVAVGHLVTEAGLRATEPRALDPDPDSARV